MDTNSALASFYSFLSAIFGILGSFGIEIGNRFFWSTFFFVEKKNETIVDFFSRTFLIDNPIAPIGLPRSEIDDFGGFLCFKRFLVFFIAFEWMYLREYWELTGEI